MAYSGVFCHEIPSTPLFSWHPAKKPAMKPNLAFIFMAIRRFECHEFSSCFPFSWQIQATKKEARLSGLPSPFSSFFYSSILLFFYSSIFYSSIAFNPSLFSTLNPPAQGSGAQSFPSRGRHLLWTCRKRRRQASGCRPQCMIRS